MSDKPVGQVDIDAKYVGAGGKPLRDLRRALRLHRGGRVTTVGTFALRLAP